MDKFGKYGNTPWEMTFYKSTTHRRSAKKEEATYSQVPGSVADSDPGYGAFLTPDPGYVFSGSQISVPGCQIHIFERLMTIF
jgi:hypothetical protein